MPEQYIDSSVYIEDLSAGTLLVHGNSRFLNGIIGIVQAEKAIADSTGKKIDETYITNITVSEDGQYLQYVKGDGTVGNLDVRDTTYNKSSKRIHELESLTSMTGQEDFLIDNGEVTHRVSVDGLLGYFASRFVGIDEGSIDITTLNAGSSIHIISPGQDLPPNQRIQGHFYLKLTQQAIDNLYDATLEDSQGTNYYLKTGRSDVSGLLFPDHFYNNESSRKYVKIITFDVTDTTSNVYVSETFDLHLVNKVSDGSIYSKYNKIHFETLFVNGTINQDSIILTCTDMSNNESLDKMVANVLCTLKDGKITLWVDSTNINTILINRTFSLSSDKAPTNANSITSGYIANYIVNDTVNLTNDTTNLIDATGDILKVNINSQYIIYKRLQALETAIVNSDLDFKFNAVTFDVASTINTTETQLNSLLIRLIDTAQTFLIINDDGTVSVSKDGYYAISLKQGYEVIDGSSVLEMNVYINSSKVEDLYTKITLSEDFYMSYSSGQVTVRLNTTDKLKVTTKWSNTDISANNYSALQVTKYLDCVEDMDFGELDAGNYPFVDMARVDFARLLYGVSVDELGDIDINTFTLPLVDVAQTDNTVLNLPDPEEE